MITIPDLNPPPPVVADKPIIVAGRVRTAANVLLWIVRLVTLFAFLSCIVAPDMLVVSLFISVFWFGIELLFIGNALQRRWVLQIDDGFIYSSLFGSETYSYDDIEGTSLYVREIPARVFGRGYVMVSIRVFSIHIINKPKPLCICFSVSGDTHEPLIDFTESVTNNVNERLDTLYRDGEPINGDGWTLSENVIVTRGERGETTSLPCDEITALHSFGGKLHLWQNDEQFACLSLPLHSKNVQWLAEFINENIEQPPQMTANAATDNTNGWGRFLFARKRSSLAKYIAIALIIPAIFIPMAFLAPMMDIESRITYGCIAVVWCLLVFAVRTVVSDIHYYENGVIITKTFSQREFLFDDVEAVNWMRRDYFYKGSYAGAVFLFYLYIFSDTGIRKLNLTFKNRKGDSGGHAIILANVINRIANRMRKQLAEHETVKLIPGYIHLNETSLIVETKRWKRKMTEEIPIEEIDDYGLLSNEMIYAINVNGRTVIKIPTYANNFYPARIVFEEAIQQHDNQHHS